MSNIKKSLRRCIFVTSKADLNMLIDKSGKEGFFHEWFTVNNPYESSDAYAIVEDVEGYIHEVHCKHIRFV